MCMQHLPTLYQCSTSHVFKTKTASILASRHPCANYMQLVKHLVARRLYQLRASVLVRTGTSPPASVSNLQLYSCIDTYRTQANAAVLVGAARARAARRRPGAAG